MLAAVSRDGSPTRMKIGFLGGSFDPVHFGHLIAAQDVYEQYKFDRLFLVPAAQAPLKPNDVQSSIEDRLAMLRAACEWDQRFEIDDYELKKGGVSYTIDSVRHFRNQYPDDELYWIIGGDQLPLLHQWKEIAELSRTQHPFYFGTQFHPEFKSRPNRPSPPFFAFVVAARGAIADKGEAADHRDMGLAGAMWRTHEARLMMAAAENAQLLSPRKRDRTSSSMSDTGLVTFESSKKEREA